MTPFQLVTAGLGFLIVTLRPPTSMTQGLQLKIPRREHGFVFNPKTAGNFRPSVTLSVFIDNTCPDSKAALPTLLKVVEHFGQGNVRLVTHLFSLPYHRHSHTIAKGAHVIEEFSQGEATYAWFQAVFEHLGQLTNSATVHKTDDEVLKDVLAPLAKEETGIPENDFISQVQLRHNDISARQGWKYACTRGVYEAPTFMINDVVVASAQSKWTVAEWINVIQPLLD